MTIIHRAKLPQEVVDMMKTLMKILLLFVPAAIIAELLHWSPLLLFASSALAIDGKSNWLEGAMLLAVYLILGIAFLFLPSMI